jgi:metal-responsive CopG/Arc/MetJ family transcriptional regulator
LKWKTVQLPEDLLNRVDKTVKQENLGYSSRADFIKEAVRLRLEQVEKSQAAKSQKSKHEQ